MKILFFGDRHYKEVKPASRIDDFYKTNLEKDKEIMEIAEKEGVDLLLHPGDFFDKPDVSDEFFLDILERWTNTNFIKTLNTMNLDMSKAPTIDFKGLKDRVIPMVSVVGNHDVYGADTSTIANTKVGLLDYLGVSKIVSKDKPYMIKTDDGLEIAITGTSYHSQIDTPENIDDYIVDEKLGDYHIHIVHGMLLDKKVSDDIFRSTLIDDITSTKADITLSGHDHFGFGLKEVDGKYFSNPGAVLRLTADKKEIKRQPKVVIIEITKENGITMKEVYLKSAKKGDEVLDRSLIEANKEKEKLQDEYNKQIKKFALTERADIYEALELTAKNEEVEDKYKDDLIERTKKKEEQMKVVASANEEVYIRKLILENFQSHENTSLDFDEGFNVLIGESSSGKTSIIRGIRWIYENKPSGRDFITVGKDFAMATVYLSNGYVISRKVEKKQSGFNGYIIKDPNGEITEGNTTMVEEVQRIAGFNDFKIDKDLTVPLNFMLQGDSWFLIGDSYSSIDRAKIIGAVKGTHYIDAVKRDLDKQNRIVLSNIKKDKKEVERLDKEIDKFDYLKELEETLNNLKLKKEEYIENKNRKEKIEKLYKEMLSYNERIENLDKVIESTEGIQEQKILILELQSKKEKVETINKKYKNIMYIEKEIKSSDEVINKTNSIEDLKKDLINIVENEERKVILQKYKDDLNNILISLKNTDDFIKSTNNIDTVKDLYTKTQEMKNKENYLDKSLKEVKSVESKITAADLIIKETEKIEELKMLNENNKSMANKKVVLDSHNSNLRLVNRYLIELDDRLNSTLKTGELKVVAEEIRKMNERIIKVNNLNLQKENYELKIKNECVIIDREDKVKEVEVEKYKDILGHLDSCPTCLNKITEKQRQLIIDSKINK